MRFIVAQQIFIKQRHQRPYHKLWDISFNTGKLFQVKQTQQEQYYVINVAMNYKIMKWKPAVNKKTLPKFNTFLIRETYRN